MLEYVVIRIPAEWVRQPFINSNSVTSCRLRHFPKKGEQKNAIAIRARDESLSHYRHHISSHRHSTRGEEWSERRRHRSPSANCWFHCELFTVFYWLLFRSVEHLHYSLRWCRAYALAARFYWCECVLNDNYLWICSTQRRRCRRYVALSLGLCECVCKHKYIIHHQRKIKTKIMCVWLFDHRSPQEWVKQFKSDWQLFHFTFAEIVRFVFDVFVRRAQWLGPSVCVCNEMPNTLKNEF